MIHPLTTPAVVSIVERAATEQLGRPWRCLGFTSLDERAAHPAGVLAGRPFSVFAKLGRDAGSYHQFEAELRGLALISRHAPVRTPAPIAGGLIRLEADSAQCLLLFTAMAERTGSQRSLADFRSVGRTLAALHQVRGHEHGLRDFDGFFGPFWQENRPVDSPRWADFYAERRLGPALRLAVDSALMPSELARGVEGVLGRLPALIGAEPAPSLLHGDAQQNNFLCSPGGTVVIDPAPYFGHPEVDLALLDYFEPMPPEVLAGYREVAPIDPGFAERTELWRIAPYLAVVSADGHSPLVRRFLGRLEEAVRRYR
jgi:fructosamine-3-kinase